MSSGRTEEVAGGGRVVSWTACGSGPETHSEGGARWHEGGSVVGVARAADRGEMCGVMWRATVRRAPRQDAVGMPRRMRVAKRGRPRRGNDGARMASGTAKASRAQRPCRAAGRKAAPTCRNAAAGKDAGAQPAGCRSPPAWMPAWMPFLSAGMDGGTVCPHGCLFCPPARMAARFARMDAFFLERNGFGKKAAGVLPVGSQPRHSAHFPLAFLAALRSTWRAQVDDRCLAACAR